MVYLPVPVNVKNLEGHFDLPVLVRHYPRQFHHLQELLGGDVLDSVYVHLP